MEIGKIESKKNVAVKYFKLMWYDNVQILQENLNSFFFETEDYFESKV